MRDEVGVHPLIGLAAMEEQDEAFTVTVDKAARPCELIQQLATLAGVTEVAYSTSIGMGMGQGKAALVLNQSLEEAQRAAPRWFSLIEEVPHVALSLKTLDGVSNKSLVTPGCMPAGGGAKFKFAVLLADATRGDVRGAEHGIAGGPLNTFIAEHFLIGL